MFPFSAVVQRLVCEQNKCISGNPLKIEVGGLRVKASLGVALLEFSAASFDTINSKLNTRASVSYSLTDREKLEMSLYADFTPSLKLMIATRTGHTKSKLCCFDKSVHNGLE